MRIVTYFLPSLVFSCLFLVLVSEQLLLRADDKMFSREVANREKSKKKKKVVKIKDREGSTISDMPYEELKKNKNALLAQKDSYTAIKYLEEMVKINDDHNEKQKNLLELADLWYQRKDYKHAQRAYEDFGILYPSHDLTGLALAREIECSQQQILSFDRDQSQTEKTLQLCNQFMERKEIFKEYVDKVVKIEKECRERILEHEMGIANFYLKGNNFKAAQHRIDNVIPKQFKNSSLVIEPEMLDFKIRLAQAQDNKTEATKYKIELAQKYPQDAKAKPFVASLPDLKLQLASLEKPVVNTAA